MKKIIYSALAILAMASCSRNVDYVAKFHEKANDVNKKSLEFMNNRELTSVQRNLAIDSLWEAASPELYEIGLKGIKKHSNDSVAVELVNVMYDWCIIDDQQAIDIISTLGPKAAAAPEIVKIKSGIESVEATAEGKPFVDFSIPQPDGTVKSLSDYAGNGKYCLVDMWASWCGPCKRQMPFIREAYEKFADKGLNVVSVAVWDKPEETIEAAEKNGIVWNQIIDAQHIPTDIYGVTGIPMIMLIGPDGTILKRNLSNEDIIAEIEKYF